MTLFEEAEAEVALHPEGVDRNLLGGFTRGDKPKSPSTRRAWIEIELRVDIIEMEIMVALHPEGVDRNTVL